MRKPAGIVGGASGIGFAAAARLLDDGWAVAVLDRDSAALSRAEDLLGDEHTLFLEVDITDEEIYRTHPVGFIGLQVHRIRPDAGPYQVAWRNIRLRELD